MQYIINTGNVANDGTGEPLRTAFTQVNLNFDQVFNAGPVGSNIEIVNNSIITTNTNGNLILAPNGVGAVVVRSTLAPDLPNIRSIGTSTNRFNTVYAQYLNANTSTFSGNLYVNGNLNVTGNIVTVNYSNLTVSNTTITLASGASNGAQADGAGILVDGANANFVYSYGSNSWTSNLPVAASAFIGDGSQLTNVTANVDAANILGNTINPTVVFSNLTTFGSVTGMSAVGDISTTGNVYANIIYGNTVVGILSGDGGNISNVRAGAITGNVQYATFAGTAATANLAALATQSINADTALFALNANLASFANNAVTSQRANSAGYSVQSDYANSAVVAGMAYELAPTANLSLTGNIYVGGILTNNYYYANGAPFSGGGSGSIIQSATPPVNPTASTLWWDEVSGRLYVYYNDGTSSQWVDAAPAGISGAGGGSGSIIQSDTAPLNPTPSTLWWNSVAGRLYVYYNDGVTSQWVDAAPAGISGPGGSSGNTGNITFNASTISTNLANTDITIQGNGYGGINILTGPNSYTQLENDSYANGSSYVWLADGNVYVETANGGWTFDNTGNLKFPDSTVQTTAYTGQSGGSTDWANIGNISGPNGPQDIIIGYNAGVNSSGQQSVAIGYASGQTSQGVDAVAIGAGTAELSQGNQAVAIGGSAGATNQGVGAVAVGYLAGTSAQGNNAVAIGTETGAHGTNSIAIGSRAGSGGSSVGGQANNTIILNATGDYVTGVEAQTDSFYVAPVRNDVGNVTNSLYYNTDTFEISYGPAGSGSTGNITFSDTSISTTPQLGSGAVGNYVSVIGGTGNTFGGNLYLSGGFSESTSTNGNVVIFGSNVIITQSGPTSVSVSVAGNVTANYFFGNGAYLTGMAGGATDWANIGNINNNNGPTQIAIGSHAGESQGINSVAIGASAGVSQNNYAVAIGSNAGELLQSGLAVAIGASAGINYQGLNAVAIGAYAGSFRQPDNTIILNATGVEVNGVANQTDSFYVAPIRNDVGNVSNIAFYNTSTYEVTYANTVNLSGNITAVGVIATIFAQLPVYTAANLILITATVGQIASVSDSPTSGGRIAFWDTTSNRWSYISDNSAV
jgi:hypothetical protein